MERPVRTKFNTQIYEEACEWFIECRAGDLDDTARAEFDRWLRKSPEHLSAYLEVAAIWNEGPTLDPTTKWDLDTLISQAAEDPHNVVALDRTLRVSSNMPLPASVNDAKAKGIPEPPCQPPSALLERSPFPQEPLEGAGGRRGPSSYTSQPVPQDEVNILPSHHEGRGRGPRSGRVKLFAVAASILVVTVVLGIYLLAPYGVYATTLGEQRSLALNDGSTVEVNSLSKIRVRYSEHERTVDLLQGQALFHVAKDAARPFIVYSGETRVRAVGTQFDVYRKADGTVITVVEGRVAVLGIPGTVDSNPVPGTKAPTAREKDRTAQQVGAGQSGNSDPGTNVPQGAPTLADPTNPAGSIFLSAGEQMTVSPSVARRTPHPNLAGATAWTQRQLVFDSASLTDVADEFNRYNERKLVIDPSALGTLHISGVFSSTDPASLIRFLRDRPDLRVTETPTEIRVEKDQ